jgi:peptidyl-tRNA hydrolase
MSTGKSAAQAAHAAVEAYIGSDSNIRNVWWLGHHYTKLVLEAEDESHLHTIQKYIEDRGFRSRLIIDEGRTEIRPHTATALGVEIVDKDDPHVEATFSTFKLYKDPQPKKRKLPPFTW